MMLDLVRSSENNDSALTTTAQRAVTLLTQKNYSLLCHSVTLVEAIGAGISAVFYRNLAQHLNKI